MNKFKLPDLQLKILRELYLNSRVTYKELGRKFKVSSVTCYNRIQEMTKENIIRNFTIDINHKKLGYTLEVLLELKVKRGLPRPVALKIHKLPHVEDVWEITGDTDLIVRAYFKDVDELNDFLHTLGNNYPEIENVITHVVLGSCELPHPNGWGFVRVHPASRCR